MVGARVLTVFQLSAVLNTLITTTNSLLNHSGGWYVHFIPNCSYLNVVNLIILLFEEGLAKLNILCYWLVGIYVLCPTNLFTKVLMN